jgi:hypothetical protein
MVWSIKSFPVSFIFFQIRTLKIFISRVAKNS